MLKRATLYTLLIAFTLFFNGIRAASYPQGLVFIEGVDAEGNVKSIGTGVLIRKGFVATNYHYVTGYEEVRVYLADSRKAFVSNGYLSVSEEKDLILLSVPGIEGRGAILSKSKFPDDKTTVSFIEDPTHMKPAIHQSVVNGEKEISGIVLRQLTSKQAESSLGGPVFLNGEIVGFNVAGYRDDQLYTYTVPVEELRPLLGRSFIIKSLNSLEDTKPIKTSRFQIALIESLTSVLWISFDDAARLSKKNDKKVIVSIHAPWCGWCKLMEKNTFSQKKIIRYINENFYAVSLDAESRDSIIYAGKLFTYKPGLRAHQLAYSLLEGNMSYPSIVFLDANVTVLTTVQGYVDPLKMEVTLHFFNEDAYLKPGTTFQKYETEYLNKIGGD